MNEKEQKDYLDAVKYQHAENAYKEAQRYQYHRIETSFNNVFNKHHIPDPIRPSLRQKYAAEFLANHSLIENFEENLEKILLSDIKLFKSIDFSNDMKNLLDSVSEGNE